MNFLVFGAGALGQALGCMLAADGHHVDLLLRPRFIQGLRSDGLKVTGIFGDFSAPGNNLSLLERIDQATKAYDFALLTTKAYDTGVAVHSLATLGGRVAMVVSMQNGCGNIEQVENCFGPERTLGARVITGFAIVHPGLINITVCADAIHIGASGAGAIPEAARSLAGILTHAGHPTLAVADIHQSLFAKLLYNCALNPLGAILGVHYGALAECRETQEVMNQVIDETFAVIAASGGKTPWADAASYREVFYQTLVPATYNHRASMLQDLEHGKRTEVDALVGYVGKMGRRFALPTPACDLLTALVKFRENHGREMPPV